MGVLGVCCQHIRQHNPRNPSVYGLFRSECVARPVANTTSRDRECPKHAAFMGVRTTCVGPRPHIYTANNTPGITTHERESPKGRSLAMWPCGDGPIANMKKMCCGRSRLAPIAVAKLDERQPRLDAGDGIPATRRTLRQTDARRQPTASST